MDKLLTQRKREWAKQRKPPMLKGGVISVNSAVAARYAAELQALVDLMTSEVEKELRDFFREEHTEEFFATDAAGKGTASQARILTNALMKKFNGMFALKAKPLAEKFAKSSDKASSSAVHGSLRELSGGLSLGTRTLDADTKQVLIASIAENVGLIKSIPQKYLQGIQGAVMRSITSGQGLEDLLPYIQKHRGITFKRARFIAYDQTRKTMNSLSRGRLEKLGMEEFQWLHTGGGTHPRKLHQELSGKVFRFDSPPIINKETGARGFPGDEPGCRCRMKAVIRFSD